MSNQVLSRLIAVFCASLLVFSSLACDEETDEPEATEEEEEVEEQEEQEEQEEEPEATLPEETMVLDLQEGESEIPATIEVPVDVNVAVDDPVTVRIDYDNGELFGIQVRAGTDFNTNLEHTWSLIDEDEHELIELDDDLLRYVRPSDALGRTENRFQLIVELDGQKWLCMQGDYGGYSEEQADRQLEACRTLTAK
jgi:hypothetical protein